jgi:hypothetical protein
VKANRAYELLVTRGRDVDHVEVVDIAEGETVLFWDTLPGQTGRLARALRTDLASMEASEFLGAWERYSI